METEIFNPHAPKKSTNLTVNSDLLRQAKEQRINLSQVLEQRLTEMLRERRCRKWQEENQQSIEDYNRRVEAEGTFGDELRQF